MSEDFGDTVAPETGTVHENGDPHGGTESVDQDENQVVASSTMQSTEPVHRLDGLLLQQIFESALHWLEKHATMINALNVFPVPDGDTGTNMLMTMRSAIKQASQQTPQDAAETARQLALGAIKGARGNSGVILSQILNGFARAGEGKSAYTTTDLAHALRRASESAYNAVMKPVEGTILTVIRAMAEAAEEAAGETTDIREQLRRATHAAHQALERTPDLLPILKEAGVVDSGGQGLVTIFEGMNRFLRGEKIDRSSDTDDEVLAGPAAVTTDHKLLLENPPAPFEDGRYGYDIQYLIRGENFDINAIRAHINDMGDCPLVIGTPELVKVHVHALSPAPALAYGVSLGMLDDIVVENMDLQFQNFVQQATAAPTESKQKELTTESLTGVGIVVVAAGNGLADHFRALGASAIVEGGQSMNPSTADLLDAIQSLGADAVILLPNNKNVIMAAQQARDLAESPVYVVPSRSAPQGFAALMAFDYSEDAETNAKTMAEAMHQIVTVEITTAVRTTTINNVAVQEGDCIGLLDGQLLSSGADSTTVIHDVLSRIDLDNYEIVGIFYGETASADAAEQLAEDLAAVHPDLTFEVHPGGQPHYSYILAIE